MIVDKKTAKLTEKLLKAVDAEDVKKAEKLLEKGADPNAKFERNYGGYKWFYTPFSKACEKTML